LHSSRCDKAVRTARFVDPVRARGWLSFDNQINLLKGMPGQVIQAAGAVFDRGWHAAES